MCGGGVLVHCPCRLSAAVSVLAPELPCGDGVFTKWALERGKAVHHFDGVMSHSFNRSPYPGDNSKLKLPSLPVQKVDVAQRADEVAFLVYEYTAAPPEEQNDRVAA